MEINKPFVFQTDSKEVIDVYSNNRNYLIEYSNTVKSDDIDYCAIYFSSNDLYYPNDAEAFNNELVLKNKFEWYGNRINYATKHIFLRDIKKQWYLDGININISTPELLLEFLKNETIGYKVITIGSSAGGYAAVLYGQQLSACKIFTFNGQFELKSLITKSSELIDPLIFRYHNFENRKDYYDIVKFIKNAETIYYFNSIKSKWDSEQLEHVKSNIKYVLRFKTNNHGLPFYRFNLRYVLNLSDKELKKLCNVVSSPFRFSVQSIGFNKTIYLYMKLSINYVLKLSSRKINKFILNAKQ